MLSLVINSFMFEVTYSNPTMTKVRIQRKRPSPKIETLVKSLKVEDPNDTEVEEYNPYLPHSESNQPPVTEVSSQDQQIDKDEVPSSNVSQEPSQIPVITGVSASPADKELVRRALDVCNSYKFELLYGEIRELERRAEEYEDRIRRLGSALSSIHNILENKDFFGEPIVK